MKEHKINKDQGVFLESLTRPDEKEYHTPEFLTRVKRQRERTHLTNLIADIIAEKEIRDAARLPAVAQSFTDMFTPIDINEEKKTNNRHRCAIL